MTMAGALDWGLIGPVAAAMGCGTSASPKLQTLDDALTLIARKDRFIFRLREQHDEIAALAVSLRAALEAAQSSAAAERERYAAGVRRSGEARTKGARPERMEG